jgi:hypothetical protein
MSSLSDLIVDTSGRVTGQIVDHLEVGFKPTTCVFTLFDSATRAIINSRNATDCLASIDTNGNLSHALTRADQAIITVGNESELHVIHFKWTYNAAADAGAADLEYTVTKDATPT